jgi:hypothetical protein
MFQCYICSKHLTQPLLPCLRYSAGSDGVPPQPPGDSPPPRWRSSAARCCTASEGSGTAAGHHQRRVQPSAPPAACPDATLRTVAASLRPSALLSQHWMTTRRRRRYKNLTRPASLPSLVEHPCPLSALGCSCKRKMTAPLVADAQTELLAARVGPLRPE